MIKMLTLFNKNAAIHKANIFQPQGNMQGNEI